MTDARRRGQRGLSLLEFTLFAIIMAVLVAFALERIAGTRVYMERAAVEHNVARMREALALEFAELAVTDRLNEAVERAGMNPLAREGVIPDHGGVKRLPRAGEREPGEWYFDASTGTVVYVPRYPESLQWPGDEPRLLRWRVQPEWVDADGDGVYDRGTEAVHGLDLVRVDDAQWR